MISQNQWLLDKERVLAWLRLGFSLTGILIVQLSPPWVGSWPALTHALLYSFFLYSLLILYTFRKRPVIGRTSFLATALDLFWILLIAFSSGVPQLLTFAFFLFPVITASSRYGIKGSLPVSLIEVAMYGFTQLFPYGNAPAAIDQLIVFSVYLIALAYIFGALFDLDVKVVQRLLSQYAATTTQTVQQERRRIAHELHDRVLQVLGSLILRLEACQKYLAHSPKDVAAELRLSEEATRSSMEEIRNIISAKRPKAFTPGTLLERLEEEMDFLRDTLGIRVVLNPSPQPLGLRPQAEEELYYAIREGLTNIARHARASEASLTLERTDGELTVTLIDNGLGFNPGREPGDRDHQSGNSGYGLRSMRERITRLGGNLSVEAAPGKGTRVFFDIPLSPIHRAAAPHESLLDAAGRARRMGSLGWPSLAYGTALGVALVAMALLPYLFWQGEGRDNFFNEVIARYQQVRQGSGEAPQAASSVTIPARLLDLTPWGYHVLSWQTHLVKGQEGRAFVYQGERGAYLLAEEFHGLEFPPVKAGQIFRTRDGDFLSYSQRGVNLVAWKYKDLLCILASTLPKEKIVRLARQIAMHG